MKRPILAITLGDPAGIGPEIVLNSLTQREIYQRCRPLVVGDAQILSGGEALEAQHSRPLGLSSFRALRHYRAALKVKPILNPAQASYHFGTVDVLHIPQDNFSELSVGKPSKIGGECSARAVKKSIELAITQLAQGVVHAPISKTAWRMAGVNYLGHTEMIGSLCVKKKVAMAIVSEPLRTVMVTRHLPLNQIAKNLKKKDIVSTIELAQNWLEQLGLRHPKIGVCALNPHAGENGSLGEEEIRVIRPAIRLVERYLNFIVSGPLPADSAFRDHKRGLYDCLVTMYHDQSLIPLKLFISFYLFISG